MRFGALASDLTVLGFIALSLEGEYQGEKRVRVN
jgi:hypothetical protein